MERLGVDADGCLFRKKNGVPVALPVAHAPLADTHGHLTSLRRMDASVVVARAALAGVRVLAVPVDPADDVLDVAAFGSWFRGVLGNAAALLDEAARAGVTPPAAEGWEAGPLVDNVRFLAGVHPYGALRFVEDAAVRERLEALLDDPLCVGVGEFGLDLGPYNELPLEVQEQAFRMQLRLAHDRGLPVELHIRDANGDEAARAHAHALRMLQEEDVPAAGCDLHCYTSGPEVLAPFARLGCHVAFGGAVTFSRSDDIRAAAVACPERLLLSETDCPYMAPVPLRGQACEPAMVAFSAACVAQARAEAGVAAEERTWRALWENACAFLGMGAGPALAEGERDAQPA